MSITQPHESTRKRAPSKRALATKTRVFNAAETVFADKGFDGATIRDIATQAGEPVGTIHHHGGGKVELFQRTLARRSDILSRARLDALAQLKADNALTHEALLSAFMRPFFTLSQDDPNWQSYARLVAIVSTDARWRDISAVCFDPTAEVFLNELHALSPKSPRHHIAEGFVFSVSAMLALLTSQSRIKALGAGASNASEQIDHLITFCAAGLRA